jgi:hypothetical protein
MRAALYACRGPRRRRRAGRAARIPLAASAVVAGGEARAAEAVDGKRKRGRKLLYALAEDLNASAGRVLLRTTGVTSQGHHTRNLLWFFIARRIAMLHA